MLLKILYSKFNTKKYEFNKIGLLKHFNKILFELR